MVARYNGGNRNGAVSSILLTLFVSFREKMYLCTCNFWWKVKKCLTLQVGCHRPYIYNGINIKSI